MQYKPGGKKGTPSCKQTLDDTQTWKGSTYVTKEKLIKGFIVPGVSLLINPVRMAK